MLKSQANWSVIRRIQTKLGNAEHVRTVKRNPVHEAVFCGSSTRKERDNVGEVLVSEN